MPLVSELGSLSFFFGKLRREQLMPHQLWHFGQCTQVLLIGWKMTNIDRLWYRQDSYKISLGFPSQSIRKLNLSVFDIIGNHDQATCSSLYLSILQRSRSYSHRGIKLVHAGYQLCTGVISEILNVKKNLFHFIDVTSST